MKIKSVILNIVISILCIVLLISIVVFIGELRSYYSSYTYDENSLLYAIEDEDYTRLVEMVHHNRAMDVEYSPTLRECDAVAAYFEAATYYLAYLKAGEQAKAAQKLRFMEEQEALMGELSYAAEDILRELGIE